MYIDKETDRESSLGDYGVRKYDNEIGRFTSIDPLWEKYRSLTPYNYSNNNPLVLKDPSGYQYDLTFAVSDDEVNGTTYVQDLKTNLEGITGLSLDIQDGKLVYLSTTRNKDANGNEIGSTKAAELLIKGIDAPEVITVSMVTGMGSFVPSQDQLRMNLDPAEIANYQSGVQNGLNPNTMGLGLSFLHESLHTTPFGTLSDPGPGSFGQIGAVETEINIIRSQLGADYGQRTSYKAALTDYAPGRVLFPFDSSSLQDILNGRMPSSYYINAPTYP